MKRKAIPPTTCEYMVRMHLKSIEQISKYMANGCQGDGLRNSMNMCVELINLRNAIIKVLDEYST